VFEVRRRREAADSVASQLGLAACYARG